MASSSIVKTVERGSFGPVLRSSALPPLGYRLRIDSVAPEQNPLASLDYAVLLDGLPLSCGHSRIESRP